ncbi:MAG: hypothetical protein OXG04_04090 [Acidobacteria bacterium]|nr:hypothetical protein [Acidobacteriota bacterium]
MTLHEAPAGAVLERRNADGLTQTVTVLSHFSNLFGSGTTYRHYGSGTVLTLDETADPDTHPEAAGDWTRTDTH